MTGAALTAVVLVDAKRDRCARALKALCAQSLIDRMEILLLDLASPDQLPVPGSEHPSVRVLHVERTLGYGQAMAIAVREARAPLLACVEEHVVVLDGWAEALVAAHRGPWAAVCGELHPGALDRVELVGRHHWNVPARRGESALLRWRNVCYKRESLLRYGDRLPLYLSSETVLFAQLRHDGERLFVEPAARILHLHEHTWRSFVVGSFHCARLDAARSTVVLHLRTVERLVRALMALTGAVRWPFALWRRTRSLPDPDRWMPLLYRNLFFIVQYYAVLAAGGALGALAGEGNSDRQFLSHEINDGPWTP